MSTGFDRGSSSVFIFSSTPRPTTFRKTSNMPAAITCENENQPTPTKDEAGPRPHTVIALASPTSVVPAEGETSMVEPMFLTCSAALSSGNWPTLQPSAKSLRTKNPIREIVDPIMSSIQSGKERDDQKEHISLALGDPTVFGNFAPCPVLSTALSATSGVSYVNALGTNAARQAIAQYHSDKVVQYSPDDVMVASGCSGTLELVLTALLDQDTILLVPQPGFPLYEVIAKAHGATVEYYRLQPDAAWQVDLQQVREMVHRFGPKIRGIVINNPSNPTGAVYSEAHLRDIVQVCDECHLPIVADEIYGELVFDNHHFHPLARITASLGDRVPVITCSGLAKQFLLPGWRIGWALFRDNKFGSLAPIHAGAKRIAQIILGASHLAQTAIPVLLDKQNEEIIEWKETLRTTLEQQSRCISSRISQIPGLTVLPSGGAMYMMVRIDRHKFADSMDDQIFSRLLLREENVFVLPGTCFGIPHAFRLVFSAPVPMLQMAADRIQDFCQRHCV